MHFSSSSRNIHLDFDMGLWLCCESQSVLPTDDDSGWITHRFPLHQNFHVGRDDPKLRYGRDGGFALTDPGHLDKNHVTLTGGTILKARVRARSGPWTDTTMCLDFFLTNMGTTLACSPPEEYLGASVAMVRVSQVWNGHTGHWEVPLTGLCIARDGQLHASSIDLSLHYVNDNGLWKKQKNGRFGDTAKDVGFDYWGNFTCRLKSHGDWGGPIQVDIYKEVRNVDGVLTIDDPAGFWDAKGEFFRILEDIPVLGYAVAVADFARGDPDEAQRALAECTLSTIAAVCSFAATVFLGPVGACLAAAAVNTGAMLAREGMHANMGEPSFFTRSVGSAVAGFFFSEFLVIAGAGLGGLAGAYMELIEEEFVANAMSGFLLKLATWGGKKALKTVTDEEFKFIMTTVIETVMNGGSQEEVQAKVDTEIQRWFEETQAPILKNQIMKKMTSLGYTWDDITIPDDVYKVTVAADYQDEARLQTVIEATVKKIIPDCMSPPPPRSKWGKPSQY
ncbi:hypothetical protein F5144DRAFT_252936 [Chaetomium tenue]|uniref:Uncharacterized protein n=1 Tax=Chaetomium tenue TaxID=1854479 RepID=A0ACB7P860_9PEZI|nr:hypothetical protein F5144DRAFT_252936 [Chaetomium globosum]